MQVKHRVKLIEYTPDPERVVAAAAKLCYSADDVDHILEKVDAGDTAKFINMLLGLGHFSPFEHAVFTFSIEGVSRSLLAQITRHRIASFSVKSQRYVSESGGFNYIIPPAVEALGEEKVVRFREQMQTIEKWYGEWQSALGGASEKANEDARFVLPNACETKMIVTMNTRELMHFFSLRCCNRAQWEIRAVAWDMLGEVLKVAPNLFSRSCASCCAGACAEGKMSCGKSADVKAKFEQLKESTKTKES